MLRHAATAGRYDLTVWEEAGTASGITQDAWLVSPRPGNIRLAVIDGSTPPPDAVGRAGVDPAAWAAAVVRAALLSARPLADALATANAYLHQPALRSQAQSMATVIAVELADDGTISLVRGGNCEAWLRRGVSWRSLFGSQWPAAVAEEHARWLAEHANASAAEVSAQEERRFGHPDAWVSVPPGRFPKTKLEALRFDEPWDELVLASDGARLNDERVNDLEGWLGTLRTWERAARTSYAAEKRHDDVTVLRVVSP